MGHLLPRQENLSSQVTLCCPAASAPGQPGQTPSDKLFNLPLRTEENQTPRCLLLIQEPENLPCQGGRKRQAACRERSRVQDWMGLSPEGCLVPTGIF